MAKSVSLAQLQADCRLYADMRPGGADAHISDTDLIRLINLEIAALYDRLLAAGGHDYYRSTNNISVVSGTSSYALPADFYQAIRLTLQWSTNDYEDVEDAQWKEAPQFRGLSWGKWTPKGYRIVGANVLFFPVPTTAVTCELNYVPTFTDLVAAPGTPTTFDAVNGWEDAVTLSVAVKMRKIARRDAADLAEERDRAIYRIEQLAANRANEAPKRIRDVYPEGYKAVWQERLPRA